MAKKNPDAWWRIFLKPLNTAPRRNNEGPEVSRSLVRRFMEELRKQHGRNKYKVGRCHREYSGSLWTIEMLKLYIKPEDMVFKHPALFRGFVPEEELQKIVARVKLSIEAIFGSDKGSVENLRQLDNHTETDIRKILDAMLEPLCVCKKLTVLTEVQTLKSHSLPTNRYDYIMYYRNQPVGFVEAKQQGCLKKGSLAQFLVQLLCLSAESPNVFYFGVLSDAHQFIFAGIKTDKVTFYQRNEEELEIATINSARDVKSIVGKISWLIDKAIQSRAPTVVLARTRSASI